MLRQFLEAAEPAPDLGGGLQESAADFRAAVTAETFDRAVKALREGLITARRDESEAAFEGLLDFVETLSVEQREACWAVKTDRTRSCSFSAAGLFLIVLRN